MHILRPKYQDVSIFFCGGHPEAWEITLARKTRRHAALPLRVNALLCKLSFYCHLSLQKAIILFLNLKLTLEEIAEILDEDEEAVSAIYIEPPDAVLHSSEDSSKEDSGGLINNLSGRQRRAGSETVLADGRRIRG